MGLEHGAWCLGCCVGLMLVLFAVGVMSLVWMALLAAVIFAEKVLPFGARLRASRSPSASLALGIFIAIAPGRAGVHRPPGGAMGMEQPAGAAMP